MRGLGTLSERRVEVDDARVVLGGQGVQRRRASFVLGTIPSAVSRGVVARSVAAELTKQLLAFGRRQVLLPEVLDLREVVAHMAKLLSQLIGAHIELVTTACTTRVLIDADRLTRTTGTGASGEIRSTSPNQ